ncbi:MAG: flavin reductase family protein [Anaerostipes sp.]|nr:flavin reductase family protein [Anaerostipes sp.]
MSEYAIVLPEDFDQSCFKLIGKEWMLVTAKNQEGVLNTMTASWGGMGVMWGTDVAVTVIRPQRYTKEFIDDSEMFTLSFYDDTFKQDLTYLGSVSGREEDKISKTRLTPTDANGIPYFEEAKIVFICKKLYKQPMNPEGFIGDAKELDEQWYSNKDYHIMYVAEIEQILVRQD